MAKKIISKDIIDEDIFSGITNDAEKLLIVVKDITKQTKQFAKALSTELKDNKIANADDVKKLEATQKAIEKTTISLDKLNKVEKEAQKQRLSEIKLQQDREKAFDKYEKTLQKQSALKKKASDEGIKQAAVESELTKLRVQKLKALAILESTAIGTEKKLLAQNTLLRIERAKLIETDKNYEANLKRINAALDKNNEKIKQNSDALKKQKMNVGNYTASIKDAFQNTGIFNNGIGNLIISLRALTKAQENTAGATGKMSAALKGGIAGAVIVAIAAIKEFVSVNQSAQNTIALGWANVKDFFAGGDLYGQAEKATQKFALDVRRLRTELQLLELDESDQNEISKDLTIGYEERNKALSESIKLSTSRAAKAVEIATRELELIDLEIKASVAGSENNELLDKRLEANLKLNDALDIQGDLVRQNATKERERSVQEAIDAVELLRSKKLSFNEDAQLLEREIQNEKNQLEFRKEAAELLIAVQNEVTDEEIRLFKEKSGIQFDENKLLNETDAIKLANQLRSIKQLNEEGELVGIGEAAISELAKIVKEYQENRIKNQEQINKLQEEEIESDKRISKIKKDILIIEQEKQLSIISDQKREAIGNYEEKKTRKEFEIAQDFAQKEVELQEKIIRDKAKNDIQAIKDKELRLEEESAEIKKIEAERDKELVGLVNNFQATKSEATKKFLEQQRKDILSIISDTTDQITTEINKRKEAEIVAQEEEIDKRKTNIERQEALAAQGLDNTLDFEKRKQAEAELERKRLQEEQEKREKRQIFFKSVIAGLENAKSTSEALQSVARATAITALADTVAGFFKDGVENFKGKGTGTSDSNIVAISNGESVVTAKGTKNYEGLATAMNNGEVEKWIGKNYSQGQTVEAYNPQLLLALRSVEKAIKEKESVNINWDGHDTRVETLVRMGHKKTVKHVNGRHRI